MTYIREFWSQPHVSFYLSVEIRCDDGSPADWLDITDRVQPAENPGKSDLLYAIASAGQRKERDRGIPAWTLSNIVVKNTDWLGKALGLFDQPISKANPLVIGNAVVSTLRRRPIRIQARANPYPNEDSDMSAYTQTIGIFQIRSISRDINRAQATITVESIMQRLADHSASLVKDGPSWYTEKPLEFLLRRLIASAVPSWISVSTPGQMELPGTTLRSTSSLGVCPNVLASDPGAFSSGKWRPTAMLVRPDGTVIVGFAVYGANPTPDGALATYSPSNGRWTIYYGPSGSSSFSSGFYPIRFATDLTVSPARLIVYLYRENVKTSTTTNQASIRKTIMNLTTFAYITGDVSPATYWPGRYILRYGAGYVGVIEGVAAQVNSVGVTTLLESLDPVTSSSFNGEPVWVPFPQVLDVEDFARLGYTNNEDDYYVLQGRNYRYAVWRQPSSYYDADEPSKYIDSGGDPTKRTQLGDELVSPGSASVICVVDDLEVWPDDPANSHPIYLRQFYTNSRSCRPLVFGGYEYWMRYNTAGQFQIWRRAIGATGFGTIETATLTPFGGEGGSDNETQRFNAAPTAWAIAANQDPATHGERPYFYIAVHEGRDQYRQDLVLRRAPWGGHTLYHVRWPEASNNPVVVISSTTVASDRDGYSADTNVQLMITDIYVEPYTATDLDDAASGRTGKVAIFTVLDRMSTHRFSYALWVGEATTTVGDLAFVKRAFVNGSYDGPSSVMPLAGFVKVFSEITDTATGTVIHFIDQAGGSVWRLDATYGTSYQWSIQNQADPVHQAERMLAVDRGGYASTQNNTPAYWICAPQMDDEITVGYFEHSYLQPASVRWVDGLYPLVQFQVDQSDIVSVADFSDMTALEAINQLMLLAPGYTIGFGDASIDIIARADQSTAGGILFGSEYGGWDMYGGPAYGVYVAEEGQIVIDDRDVRTEIEVVPYEFSNSEDPKGNAIRQAGSEFAGQFRVRASTLTPTTIAVTAAYTSVIDNVVGEQPANLFVWQKYNEEYPLFLATAASAADTVIRLGGIRYVGNEVYYAGSRRMDKEGTLQVGDGGEVTYTVIAQIGDAVSVSLSAPVGVDAAIYSPVTIRPFERRTRSDHPDGLSKLQAAIDASQVLINVDPLDYRLFPRESVIRVDEEWMRVRRIYPNGELQVTRGYFGSEKVTHAIDTPVLGWMLIDHPGTLYAVGDTGIRLGVELDMPDVPVDATAAEIQADLEARTILAGEGVRIVTTGYALTKAEAARVVASSTVARDEIGDKEMSIDSRFMDRSKAKLLAIATLEDRKAPRVKLTNVKIAFAPHIGAMATMTVRSPMAHAGSTNLFLYEVTSVQHDFNNRSTTLNLVSIDPVPDTGWDEESATGRGSVQTGTSSGREPSGFSSGFSSGFR